MICYDIEFPEWTRVSALAGAQLLCVPTNWPHSPRPHGERPMELIRAQAAASTNRMFIAVCDRVGDERHTSWVGGSAVIDASGWLASPLIIEQSGRALAECALEAANDKSISEHNNVHVDRRSVLYANAIQALNGPASV